MAEYLLKEMVRQQGLAAQFQIASAATSRECFSPRLSARCAAS